MKNFTKINSWLKYLEYTNYKKKYKTLKNIKKVFKYLKLSFSCPIISVGGTNGKGSICSILESILLNMNLKVGCYTSPHLLKFNERIKINGKIIDDYKLLKNFKIIEKKKKLLKNHSLTYFEFITLVALKIFHDSKLDIIILEVGLGGKLDAVNIINADCAIISNIELDHTNLLGHDKKKIALEKSGIFRYKKIAICSDLNTQKELIKFAKNNFVNLYILNKDFFYNENEKKNKWTYIEKNKKIILNYPSLYGKNQLINSSAAIACISKLCKKKIISKKQFNKKNISKGLQDISLSGRFQIINKNPTIILDVAHNPNSSLILKKNLINININSNIHAIFGLMSDKDILNIVINFKESIKFWYLTDISIKRGLNVVILKKILNNIGINKKSGYKILQFSDSYLAFKYLLLKCSINDNIIVFGSFHVISKIINVNYKKYLQNFI